MKQYWQLIKDDISYAVNQGNQEDTKIGLSVSAGLNTGVYYADASTNFGVDVLNKLSEETVHTYMRQQTEKLLTYSSVCKKSMFVGTGCPQELSTGRCSGRKRKSTLGVNFRVENNLLG